MSTAPSPLTQNTASAAPVPLITPAPASADRWIGELHALLQELEAITSASHALPPVFHASIDDRLVQVRLGVVASLFTALQCKNAAVAGHALRVALTCSAWSLKLDLPESQRDVIEVAALLHDIGMVGVPDHILLKADMLDPSEAAVMAGTRKMTLDILGRSCTSPQILEIVENISTWYDGSRKDRSLRGREIPLGARMIAIAEAFDAITTDHVYRPARSQERAIAELFECSGTQFDPELVQRFVEFRQEDQAASRCETAHRWLHSLEPGVTDTFGAFHDMPSVEMESAIGLQFHDRLLDNMYDAVVFIDAAGHVMSWNRGAERLTGIAGGSLHGQVWRPELLGLADEKGRPINEADCPVQIAIGCGVQSIRRLTILGRSQQPVAVDSHAIPVIDEKGVSHGAILLFHDASSETSLEQRCQKLHEKATKDPLTQVANRAEYDRVHAMFVAAHQQQQVPCSLLMCDLDRFKLVNDTFGHQAGDEAIKCLASLMKSLCRPGDLVARYGGEEFVMLCADCDNASAVRRAEQIRKSLGQISQPKMDGRNVTVSFGVTEIQPGDTPETMLRRADRALLMAKANGRNCVVQLGTGGAGETVETQPTSWFRGAVRPKALLRQELVTPVPVKIAVEKLRGFVADHRAKIISVNGNRMRLEIEDKPVSRLRRLTDRTTVFWIDLSFEEERIQKQRESGSVSYNGGTTRTRISITVTPRKNRDRRRDDIMAHARDVLVSFRSYLIASEEDNGPPSGALSRAKRMLAPWLRK